MRIRYIAEGRLFARAVACAVAPAVLVSSCAAPVRLGADVGYSSNPTLTPGGTGDPAAGARFDARCSFGDADPFLVEASARGVAFDGGGGDYIEGHFAGSVPLVTYTATRLVEPHGPDLGGLHPRVVQGLSAKAVFYAFDLRDVEFREDALSGLDSRTLSHAVAIPFSLDAWLDREPAVSFFLYSRLEGESAGVTDYESETGLFVLSLAGPDLARAGYDPSWAGWTVDAALGRPGSLALGLGWRSMGEFVGPVADPSGEVTSFAGFLVGSLGPFTMALRRMPGPSLVSNYQIDTSAELAFAAGAGRWLARARVGFDEADRSRGPDLSLWKAAAGVEVLLTRDWVLKLDLGWRERSSTAPGGDYDVFSAFLGVAWEPRAPFP